jgi:transcriptional regulator with XRE-family HTH domain
MNVQTAVADLRKKGLSDSEIAEAIGCGTSTVNMWANGKRAQRTGDYMFKLYKLHSEKCPARSKIQREAA